MESLQGCLRSILVELKGACETDERCLRVHMAFFVRHDATTVSPGHEFLTYFWAMHPF